MRAVLITDPTELVLSDVEEPVAGPGEVLVEVAAAGVNRADLLQRSGHHPPPAGAPAWPGLEVSGVVTEIGPGVPGRAVGGWAVGDRVAALVSGGGYAERVAVPAGQLFPVPDGMDLVDAGGLPEAVCTTWTALREAGRMVPGESVLIRGGSGGVGSVAVQVAAALGAHVLATAGGPARTEQVAALGADQVFDHRAPALPGRVLDATAGRGVDVVLDVLGAGGLTENLRMLAVGGRVVVIGLQQGARGTIDLGDLLTRRASVSGTALRSRSVAEKAMVVRAVRDEIWPMLADGRLHPVVHARLPLADAARAHALLGSGTVLGKLLLLP